jgi:hypothetical protein
MLPILSVSRAAEALVDRAREALRRTPKAAGQGGGDAFGRALATAGTSFPRWLRQRRANPRQYVELALPHLTTLRAAQPGLAAATVAAAEVFLQHRFDLLGSGPFSPADPDRPARGGYRPIDWYLDPVRQLRFPRGVPSKEWKLYEMRPGNADVKYPWELARSHHWVTLAQAWQLSRDARFAREIVDQLDDFVEANPVGMGINWTCTMDVAIRAANWCLAIALALDCAALEESFWRRAYSALYDHAAFIFTNFENKYEVTSNHYLSNVVGLHVLACDFYDLEAGAEWEHWCRDAVETEINVQIHDEGTDFESAVPYHRLVTELFMASARLARLRGQPLSATLEAKLARMVDFTVAITRPDGRMPVIGDADDGRLHIFSHFGNWDRQDCRHLLAPAALLLERGDLLAHADAAAAWEAAWWGFDPAQAKSDAKPARDGLKLFPAFGVAVARRGGHYLAITNGAVGTKGFGNHKHNELLSFEHHCGGVPVIVDPGSYVYTSDFAARNLFRGTAYHNTLTVDGVEQNELNSEWIFRLFEKANPEHLSFVQEGECAHYRGRHSGYTRLESPVVHERDFAFDLRTAELRIEDILHGTGTHDLHWHFHCAPGVVVVAQGADRLTLKALDGNNLDLVFDSKLNVAVVDAWYSPSYGVHVPVQAVNLACRAELAGRRSWKFLITASDRS